MVHSYSTNIDSAPMSNVILQHIVKRYDEIEVVHGIDLTIAPKEFVVLVGPSGCGKSTTLRMIAGLEEISDGELQIDDRVVNRVAPKDRDVAMVFQNYALYPHLNVAENIAFGLRIRKESKEHIAKSVSEVGEILGLTPYLQRRPADLSGGQRQRVAMGRAIVRRPKVFLFDEPLSNLDAKLRTQMRAEIKRLHKRLGATSVYVTHDQVEAMTLADRIVVMNDGRIEQVGSPMDLFMNPANTFVAGFIGSPPMNQLNGVVEVTSDGLQANVSGNTFELLESTQVEPGQAVVVGIRPEHLSLHASEHSSTIPISLDLVETLGSEALLHATVGEVPIIIKVETHGNIDHLHNVKEVFAPMNLVKLFDMQSGLAIDRKTVA